jgi:4-hydroxy-tetrahydrodipicolinate synthase
MGAMFKGAIVAIATPFKKGKVDEEALRGLIEFQIKNGTDGIVPCGTTGESPVLSHKEHGRVVEITVNAVKKRVPVIAGTGSNSTDEAIRLTRHAYDVGADGALIVAPYYNRPTQEGLYQHYKLIAEKVPIPIIVYNIPSRTGVNITPDTMAKLSKIKNIVGVTRRPRDYLRCLQCGARCRGGACRRHQRREDQKGQRASLQADTAGEFPLYRDQPRARQGGAGHDGKDPVRNQASAGEALRCQL